MFEKIERLKADIDSFKPLSDWNAGQLKQYYRVALTYTSNALEGNTLTENRH